MPRYILELDHGCYWILVLVDNGQYYTRRTIHPNYAEAKRRLDLLLSLV